MRQQQSDLPMRKIFETLSNDKGFAAVRGKNAYGEYVVTFYPRSLFDKPTQYFTDDREDAIATSLAMAVA